MRPGHVNTSRYHTTAITICLALAVLLTACGSGEPETATVIVRTLPENVNIMVDGTDYGTTPTTITDLALGCRSSAKVGRITCFVR